MNMIPYGRQNISEDDINAVIEVLRSDFITLKPLLFLSTLGSHQSSRMEW